MHRCVLLPWQQGRRGHVFKCLIGWWGGRSLDRCCIHLFIYSFFRIRRQKLRLFFVRVFSQRWKHTLPHTHTASGIGQRLSELWWRSLVLFKAPTCQGSTNTSRLSIMKPGSWRRRERREPVLCCTLNLPRDYGATTTYSEGSDGNCSDITQLQHTPRH